MRAAALVGSSLALFLTGAGCHAVKGQPIPRHIQSAELPDFDPGDRNVAVLHYYGTGGWGIRWKDTYLLTAPYFSNHGYLASSVLEAKPNTKAIRAGFAGTPYEKTKVILVGHGHVDHAADIPAYPLDEMHLPTLIADRSTIHLLGDATRDRVCEVPLQRSDANRFLPQDGPCPTGDVRIRPIPWAHAPHESFLGDQVFVTFGSPQGAAKEDLAEPPESGGDWLVGPTWGYVIDLMEGDEPVFRIHYVDAAASPAFVGQEPLADRPTDVHIACVPGFDLVRGYPEDVIDAYRVGYVLAGHWEDFFRRRTAPLAPVAVLDDAKMEAFVSRTEAAITNPRPGPISKAACSDDGQPCGPHGDRWAVPIPGETFWFRVLPVKPQTPR